MHSKSAQGLSTLAIHAGSRPDPITGAILTPIHQNTTYIQDSPGQDRGFAYSRSGNPTVAALERRLGELEEAEPALCFSTGMAATTALLLSELNAGEHVVVSNAVYGGTARLLEQVLARFALDASFVDASELAAVAAAIRPETKMVFVETPANPTLAVCDIAAIAGICREAEVCLAVDNTFLTAALQRPLDLGADVSVYSTTKFIEGHNSTVGGAIVTRSAELRERVEFVRNTVGSIQSPWEAWLTLRGIKTLPLRMKLHSRAALEVARFLESHPGVTSVSHPGLESFPQREIAERQQLDSGGLVSFEVVGGVQAGRRVMESVELCSLAENLGAVETLITHPASMTHASMSPELRAEAGIGDGLIRLSVGLEETRDIISDLEQALEKARGES